ncbi:transcriptional regulator, LacI family [Quadrisphaera sp. DSM 44207]|nr:transcriptional regulator, LacI family [Quadrisphaera sp. DSM 44207]
MRDVALAAGVSPKTVSNVVNGYVHVRAETRERVQRVVDELGYRPQAAGRQLRRGRSGLVALAVPGIDMPYFADLARHLVTAARAHDLTVLVEQTDGLLEREREAADGFGVRFVDGLVLSPLAMAEEELTAPRHDTALVLLGEHAAHAAVDRVGIDSVDVACTATRHLLAGGRRRVAMVGAKTERPASVAEQRQLGWASALQEAGLRAEPGLARPVPDWTREDGEAATDALLAEHPDVDAVFASNDVLALGALRSLRRHGRSVPDDVAVVGVDDLPEAAYSAPTLTTVAIDRAFVAAAALDLLTSRLDDADLPPRTAVAPHRLVVRESAP